jgi:arylsulfatase A-like enzyme
MDGMSGRKPATIFQSDILGGGVLMVVWIKDYANSIRSITACLLLVILAACCFVTTRAEADLLSPGSRPNIVVIMTDDLDEMLLQSALDANLLPQIEQTFILSGVKMSNSFVSNSECCPSRATFMSGQYTHNHGVLTNAPPFAFPSFNDSVTIATWLTDAGYLTGFTGKYLNGYAGAKDLNGDGNIDPDELGYIPPGWHWWQGLLDPSTYKVYGYSILNSITGDTEYYADRYQTETLSEKAVSFIDSVETEDDLAPFFLWVSTLAPHSEISPETVLCQIDTGSLVIDLGTIRPAPAYDGAAGAITLPKTASFNETDISDKPNWFQNFVSNQLNANDIACIQDTFRDKLESLLSVDDLVGNVLDALERNGETSETVIIFTSDNGFQYGQHRLARPSKTYPYEESIRVPLYFRDLSVNAPRSIEFAALNNDMAPTFVDLAGGIPATSIDGRSLLPTFEQTPPSTWRKRILVEHYYKYVVPTYSAIRNFAGTDFTYVEYKSAIGPSGEWLGCVPGLCEWYMLETDPFQNTSRHDAPQLQNFIPTMQKLLRGLRQCSNGTCKTIEDL